MGINEYERLERSGKLEEEVMSKHTPVVDDVTAAIRNDALEIERRNNAGLRANGDADRLRATADYIDDLHGSRAELLEALKRALPRVQALYDSMGGRDNELVLNNMREVLAKATQP